MSNSWLRGGPGSPLQHAVGDVVSSQELGNDSVVPLVTPTGTFIGLEQ